MKKFAFSLDKVLTYKEQIEFNLRAEYAQIMQKIQQEEEKLLKLEQDYSACSVEYEDAKREGSTIKELKVFEGYLEGIRARMKQSRMTIARLKAEEARKREEVIQAKTETSSIDRLKEKRIEEYTVAVRKEEENLIEEFVSNTTSVRVKVE